MSRPLAVALAAALVAAAGCTADARPTPQTPAAESATATPTPTASSAWSAPVRVRRSVGRGAPWLWEYSDDVVVIGPRGLVSLDRATGAEVWRLPLGGPVCGATRSPSEVGIVAVSIGRCQAAGSTRTVRRTTVKGIDLESASVVWERPFIGEPSLDVGGEVLLATAGCGARRIDLSTGRTLEVIDAACSDRLLVGHGVAVVSSRKPRAWRAIDVASGSTVSEVTPPASMSDPQRLLTADPLTVLVGARRHNHLQLVRLSSDEPEVLADVSDVAADAWFFTRDESLVLADPAWPGATEFSLEDGSSLGGFPGVGGGWVPVAHLGEGLLGVEGEAEAPGNGHLTLRSLRDGSVTELGEIGPVAGAARAVVIGDTLLMPTRGSAGVAAYRLRLPSGD